MNTAIQMVRVPVRIAQAGGPARDGSLALRFEIEPGRPQTLIELLNQPRLMLPFFEADDSVALLNRLTLEWVAASPGFEAHRILPPHRSITRRQQVELRFASGPPLAGTIQWEASKEHLRVSDVLNGPDEFFALLSDTGVRIVNRQRVFEARLIGMPGL